LQQRITSIPKFMRGRCRIRWSNFLFNNSSNSKQIPMLRSTHHPLHRFRVAFQHWSWFSMCWESTSKRLLWQCSLQQQQRVPTQSMKILRLSSVSPKKATSQQVRSKGFQMKGLLRGLRILFDLDIKISWRISQKMIIRIS